MHIDAGNMITPTTVADIDKTKPTIPFGNITARLAALFFIVRALKTMPGIPVASAAMAKAIPINGINPNIDITKLTMPSASADDDG